MTRMDFHRLSPEIATKAVMFNDMIHCAHRDRPIPNDLDMTHETFLQELCMTCSFAFSVLMFIRSMPCKLSKFTCLTIHATCCHHQTCMYGFCNVITANIPAARLFPAFTGASLSCPSQVAAMARRRLDYNARIAAEM
jgi:hypothetical protein